MTYGKGLILFKAKYVMTAMVLLFLTACQSSSEPVVEQEPPAWWVIVFLGILFCVFGILLVLYGEDSRGDASPLSSYVDSVPIPKKLAVVGFVISGGIFIGIGLIGWSDPTAIENLQRFGLLIENMQQTWCCVVPILILIVLYQLLKD